MGKIVSKASKILLFCMIIVEEYAVLQ